MSLYNQLFGVNKFAGLLLGVLGLDHTQVPRIRDVYINDANQIVIFTRTGGGNRAEYAAGNEALTKVPGYLSDADDEWDNTYALFVYEAPEPARALIPLIRVSQGPYNPMGRFKQMLADMEADKDTPDVQKAKEVGRGIMGQMQAAIKAKEADPDATGPIVHIIET